MSLEIVSLEHLLRSSQVAIIIMFIEGINIQRCTVTPLPTRSKPTLWRRNRDRSCQRGPAQNDWDKTQSSTSSDVPSSPLTRSPKSFLHKNLHTTSIYSTWKRLSEFALGCGWLGSFRGAEELTHDGSHDGKKCCPLCAKGLRRDSFQIPSGFDT